MLAQLGAILAAVRSVVETLFGIRFRHSCRAGRRCARWRVHAATAVPLAGADPADPGAKVAGVGYRSTIAPYTSLRPPRRRPGASRTTASPRRRSPASRSGRCTESPTSGPTAASRLRCGPAAGVLLSTLLLFGCATFSPDGGMTVVADVAGETIKKDVVSIRTEDDAQRANASVQGLLRRGLTVDTAVQIALLNNRGLQASYNELALAEADLVQRRFAAQSDLLDFADRRRRRAGDRAAGGRRHPRFGDPAVPLGNRPPAIPEGAIARRRGDAAARSRRPAHVLSRGRGQRTGRPADRRQVDGGIDRTARVEARPDRRTEQARSGPRAGLLRGDDGRSRNAPTGCHELPGAPDPVARIVGRRPRFPAAAEAAGFAAPSAFAATHRGRCGRTSDRSADRPHRTGRSRQVARSHRSQPLRHDAGCRRNRPKDARSGYAAVPGARFRRAVSDSDLRRRRSPRPAGCGDLQSGLQPVDREGGECPLRSARRVPGLPLDLRHRQPLSARSPAAAQDHLGRDAAPLQQHAGRRVRAADRGKAADRRVARRHRGQARISGWRNRNCRPRSTAAAEPTLNRSCALRRPLRPAAADTEMEKPMLSRRNFLGTATALASATAISGRAQAANIPEAPSMDKATMQPPLRPISGPDYNPSSR